uniref:Rhomboid-like protease n=1 Tax=Theileria annulata TaxID=5874 RepID=A0A3B0N5F3_THEAN
MEHVLDSNVNENTKLDNTKLDNTKLDNTKLDNKDLENVKPENVLKHEIKKKKKLKTKLKSVKNEKLDDKNLENKLEKNLENEKPKIKKNAKLIKKTQLTNTNTSNSTKDITKGKGANNTFDTTPKGANFIAMECTTGKGANSTAMECTTKYTKGVGEGAGTAGPSTVTEDKNISREKVAKLKKKFETKKNQSTYNKVINLFKQQHNLLTEQQNDEKNQLDDKNSLEDKKLLNNENNSLNEKNTSDNVIINIESNTNKQNNTTNTTTGTTTNTTNTTNTTGVGGTTVGMNKIKGVKKITTVLGGYPVLTLTSSVILFVFLFQIILNKISFNGRCISKVLYPNDSKAYHTMFGYGACEYNLQQKIEEIGYIGTKANDKGWPSTLVSDENVVESTSTFDSPNYRGFTLFGGMNTNYIRNYKEYFRLFWSMFMHSGVLHLIFNLIAQTQILWIIEPDWGFFRSLSTFILSGFMGNLFAGVFEPSFTVVGSSGCMFGLIAALIPYCVENWSLLRSPIYIFAFAIIITIISFTFFNNTVSIYSHLGGWVGGLLWGFITLRSTFKLKDCAIKESLLLSFFKDKLNPDDKNKLKESFLIKQRKCINEIRIERRRKKFKQRIKNLIKYPIDYFKKGPYDILIRIIPLILFVILIIILCSNLLIESIYNRMFLLNESSNLSQCCYTNAKSEIIFNRKVFWCFENYQTAINFCKI